MLSVAQRLAATLLLPSLGHALSSLSQGPVVDVSPDDFTPADYTPTLASGTLIGKSHLPPTESAGQPSLSPPYVGQEAPANKSVPVEVAWPFKTGPVVLPAISREEAAPNVARTIGDRIREDSFRLGLIAQHLLQAQSHLHVAQEDVLSKVFDMKTEHGVNKQDWELHRQLQTQVARLRGELEARLKILGEKAGAHGGCHQSVKSGGGSGTIGPDDQVKDRWQGGEAVRNGDGLGRDTGADGKPDGFKDSVEEPSPMPPLSPLPDASHPQGLEDELIKQHKDAIQCSSRVRKLQEQARSVMAKHDDAYEEAMNITRAELEEQKRLTTLNEALEPRLNKSLQNAATINFQFALVARQHELLRQYGKTLRASLAQELREAEEKANRARGNLSFTLQHRHMTQNVSGQLEAEIKRLEAQLHSGKLALAQTDNERLKADMQRTAEDIRTSRIAIFKARTAASSAQAQKESWGNITAAHQSEAQNITESALKSAVKIKASDDELEEKAQAAIMRAEAGASVPCTQIWDEDHPKIMQELERCSQVKDDLHSAQAIVATMASATQGMGLNCSQ